MTAEEVVALCGFVAWGTAVITDGLRVVANAFVLALTEPSERKTDNGKDLLKAITRLCALFAMWQYATGRA